MLHQVIKHVVGWIRLAPVTSHIRDELGYVALDTNERC